MKISREITVQTLIRGISQGFRTLPRVSWVLNSGYNIPVAGLLGLVFVLGIKDGRLSNLNLLPWSSVAADHSEKLRLLPGLQNLGNNCFLNVILQALASCVFFQSFLQTILEESDVLKAERPEEILPLTLALAALLEELCVVGQERVVLSPRKVMLSMACYVPNFSLTNQQDAAEAFLHLLSSLRQEFLDFYHPHGCGLFAAGASSCRILAPGSNISYCELERWKHNFLGPFDGILCSVLTCQSCSSQISLCFDSFHSLLLPPVPGVGSPIMAGCTLGDCLKHFTRAEQVENYYCSQCWHNSALKYLSSTGGSEMEIEKLRMCNEKDSCDCRRLLNVQKFPWSNKLSRTLKQLTIARCPKILCIYLKRASINVFGEQEKLEGHISFPLVLDLFPFMTTGMGLKDLEENLQRRQVSLTDMIFSPSPYLQRTQMRTGKLYQISGGKKGDTHSKDPSSDEACLGETGLSNPGGCSNSFTSEIRMECDEMVSTMPESVRSMPCLYRLVSVVEHFGKTGSGHYTVYRCVEQNAGEENVDGQVEDSVSWFCISDSEVSPVPEKDVLAAEATMLFYERILEG